MIEHISYQEWVKQGKPATFTDTVELKWIQHPTRNKLVLVNELTYLRDKVKMYENTGIQIYSPIIHALVSKFTPLQTTSVFVLDKAFKEKVINCLDSMFYPSKEFLEDNPNFKEQYSQLEVMWRLKNDPSNP